MSESKRLVRSVPFVATQTASKNPNAGLKTYFDDIKETRRQNSAPLENKVFTHYCRVIDHDDLRNKGLHKKLGSLEENYTRGVRQKDRKENKTEAGPFTRKLAGSDTSSTTGANEERPWSPIPALSRNNSVSIDGSIQPQRRLVPKRDTDGAAPQEWTKQRVHENNMEWRSLSGYEVKMRF